MIIRVIIIKKTTIKVFTDIIKWYIISLKYRFGMLGGKMEVKLARIKKKLTQAQLCKLVKTSPKKLVEIERGNYDMVTLGLAKRLAKVLDTNVVDLFFKEGEEQKMKRKFTEQIEEITKECDTKELIEVLKKTMIEIKELSKNSKIQEEIK